LGYKKPPEISDAKGNNAPIKNRQKFKVNANGANEYL
jgi:hypothetical protein